MKSWIRLSELNNTVKELPNDWLNKNERPDIESLFCDFWIDQLIKPIYQYTQFKLGYQEPKEAEKSDHFSKT